MCIVAILVVDAYGHASCHAASPGFYKHSLFPTCDELARKPVDHCKDYYTRNACILQFCCDDCANQRNNWDKLYPTYDKKTWMPDGFSWRKEAPTPEFHLKPAQGNGDIDLSRGWHCTPGSDSSQSTMAIKPVDSLNASSPMTNNCHQPVAPSLVGGNLLYAHGGPNHLDRVAGRCPADPHHSVSGTTLNISDVKEVKVVKSLGECCDLCHSVSGCGGWTVHMPPINTPENPAPATCTLVANDAKLGRAYCRNCYSGTVTRPPTNPVELATTSIAV